MDRWTADELAEIGRCEEVRIASVRSGGSLRHPVTVWVARAGEDLYVRSAVKGRNAAWFRGVAHTHQGRLWAGGVVKDVTFVDGADEGQDDIDASYRTKYRRYAGRILDSVLTPEARATTTKLLPRAT